MNKSRVMILSVAFLALVAGVWAQQETGSGAFAERFHCLSSKMAISTTSPRMLRATGYLPPRKRTRKFWFLISRPIN